MAKRTLRTPKPKANVFIITRRMSWPTVTYPWPNATRAPRIFLGTLDGIGHGIWLRFWFWIPATVGYGPNDCRPFGLVNALLESNNGVI